MYYFIKKETGEIVIAIIYINDTFIMDIKDSLLFLELKQKFIKKRAYYDLEETKEFFEIYISWNCNYQRIFVDQSKYLNKVLAYFNIATNPTSTSFLLGYVFKPNNK